MSTGFIDLSSVGSANSSSFSIYSDADNYTTPIITGVSSSSLLSGYNISVIPGNATKLKFKSNDLCGLQPVSGLDIQSFPTPTPEPTYTPTPTPTSIPPTNTPTPTPTITSTPTVTPTPTPTYHPGYYILVNDSSASYPGTGTTWTSIATGTTYNGTLTNGPVWSGGTPGYFTFDGTNDWVDFGSASSGSTFGEYTFGGWVKTTTSATEKIFMMRGNDASLNGWSLLLAKLSDNKFLASVVTTSPSVVQTSAISTTTMSNDTWYYIVAVWEPGIRIRIYVNGVLETTTTTTGIVLRDPSLGWNLMRNNNGTFTNGDLSEFIVYQTALTGPQIGNNFNLNASKYGY